MKIAYIVLKGMPLGGGIEKYTEEVGSRLADRGHDVTVYTMRHYGAVEVDYKGMKIKTIPTPRCKSFEKLTASFLATIKHCLEDKDTDIAHYHAFGPAMFNFIPRLLGRKVVVQGHGLEWKRAKWGLSGRLFLKMSEMPSVKFPHVVTVVSKEQQKYVKSRYGIDSVYIPTGVNPPQFEPPDLIQQYGLKENNYILFAARLVREKGVQYLIEAYNQLKTGIKLVIAGDAQHEEAYKSEIYKLADGNKNIIFPGFVTGKLLHELFSNCRVFVLPSEIEGLPTTLLEAMSYGKACLVSDIPENIEALNGLGYSFKNQDVKDLTEKLQDLLSGDVDKRLVENARKHVLKNHSWDDISERFETLYKKTIGWRLEWNRSNSRALSSHTDATPDAICAIPGRTLQIKKMR
jgi:glycosyltransferase involved in cell wall biosynthesis